MTKPTHPDAIDQSWGYADPKAAYADGIRVVSMYLSHDVSKNVTAAKVKAYHAAGIGVLLNWEAQSGAPLNGASQGQADASEAVRQAQALVAAVGYKPGAKLSIIFSCDRDTTSANYPAIDAYYNATRKVTHAAGYLNGVYGEYDLIIHLHSKGLTDVEWQTYAWSGGRLSPEADFYQYLNGQHMARASVDFDKVEHAAQLGAWWPPGHPVNKPTPAPEEDMTPQQAADLAEIKQTVETIAGFFDALPLDKMKTDRLGILTLLFLAQGKTLSEARAEEAKIVQALSK